MKILIVGGGIGGLTLAIALKRHGLQAQVIERAEALRAVGAGITIQVNAAAVLRQFGLGEALSKAGHPFDEAMITDELGQILSRVHFSDRLGKLGKSIALHRSDLHQLLYEPVQQQVRLNCGLMELRQTPQQVWVGFSDGSQESYDLVVGADGIRSQTRRLAFGPIEPRYAGYDSWRFVLPASTDLSNPIEMWGRGVRLGLVPIGKGLIYGFTTFSAHDDPAGRIALFHRLFGGFAGPAKPILPLLNSPDQLIHTRIEEVSLPNWYKGRVVLLGDAAHAMTPNLGQGAGMAIEDAYVLAEQLATKPLPAALAGYQQQRQQRVQQVQNTARLLGQVGQWVWAPAVALRNFAVKATPAHITRGRSESILCSGPIPA